MGGRGKGALPCWKRGERGILACEQGHLLPGLESGKLGGGGSKRHCSQARSGEGFASQHNVFFLSFSR